MKSRLELLNVVEIFDGKTGELLFFGSNAILATGKKLVMDFLRKEAVDGIQVLAVEDAAGEIFRKAPTSTDDPTNTERIYTFFLAEDEPPSPPNDIVKLKLCGDDATTTLDTGVDFSEIAYARTKGANQSLLINWTVRVV